MIQGSLIIVYTFAIVGLSFLASLLHELGHWLYFRMALNKKVILTITQTGTEKDYKDLSKKQKIQLYFSGVFLGLIFIVVVSSIDVLLATSLIIYIGGCRSDIRKIVRLI